MPVEVLTEYGPNSRKAKSILIKLPLRIFRDCLSCLDIRRGIANKGQTAQCAKKIRMKHANILLDF